MDILENPEDYKTFEAAVTSDFNAQTVVERELVLRLASLVRLKSLWFLSLAGCAVFALVRVSQI